MLFVVPPALRAEPERWPYLDLPQVDITQFVTTGAVRHMPTIAPAVAERYGPVLEPMPQLAPDLTPHERRLTVLTAALTPRPQRYLELPDSAPLPDLTAILASDNTAVITFTWVSQDESVDSLLTADRTSRLYLPAQLVDPDLMPGNVP